MCPCNVAPQTEVTCHLPLMMRFRIAAVSVTLGNLGFYGGNGFLLITFPQEFLFHQFTVGTSNAIRIRIANDLTVLQYKTPMWDQRLPTVTVTISNVSQYQALKHPAHMHWRVKEKCCIHQIRTNVLHEAWHFLSCLCHRSVCKWQIDTIFEICQSHCIVEFSRAPSCSLTQRSLYVKWKVEHEH